MWFKKSGHIIIKSSSRWYQQIVVLDFMSGISRIVIYPRILMISCTLLRINTGHSHFIEILLCLYFPNITVKEFRRKKENDNLSFLFHQKLCKSFNTAHTTPKTTRLNRFNITSRTWLLCNLHRKPTWFVSSVLCYSLQHWDNCVVIWIKFLARNWTAGIFWKWTVLKGLLKWTF